MDLYISVKVVKVMNKNKKRHKYDIKNINCANCAAKIEKRIRELDEVSDVNLDFVNKKLTITSNNDDLLGKLNEIAHKIEPGTKITEENVIDDNKNNRLRILKIIIGFCLFFLALTFEHYEIYKTSTVILFIVSYAVIGFGVIYKAFFNIKKGNFFDENFLMTIATLAAVYVKSYPEAVAVMLFYEVGELFQDLAVDRSRKSIKKLIDIQPKYANVLRNDKFVKVSPDEVDIGETIIIKPGEKIPLDGIIVKGASSVDTSQLTGESIPKVIQIGDEVLAGFINFNGLLEIKVTKMYRDSAVSKILELVENAQSKKARAEKLITKFARIYTPIVILAAVLVVILPILFVKNYDFNDYLYRGAIFLVVSCPCALVISIPLSIFGGIGASSRQGILIKGGNYLDVIRRTGIIVFDKTGTLTKGNFVVTKVVEFGIDKDELIKKTIMAEKNSGHAIAKAIVSYAKIDIDQGKIKKFEEFFGKGIYVNIDDEDILVGNAKLMNEFKIEYTEAKEVGTIVYVAINNHFKGYFVINDEIKPEAQKTIAYLKKSGMKTLMLTGDSNEVAQYVGKELAIDEVYANLLPEDKMTIMNKIKKEYPNKSVMFVGDGINDTPVLTASDVGVAMGGLGSDAAIETSDVVIMNDDLNKLISAKALAQLTHRKIWQNIILALGVKSIVLILGAIGLATMWMAVFSDVGVALLAVFNSILILRFKNKC